MTRLTKAGLCSLLVIEVFLLAILCACSNQDASSNGNTSPGLRNRVEIVYFHRDRRCYSCTRAEQLITYTIDTYYQKEVNSGKLVYKVLNVQDEANAAIAGKYGAYGSSLFLNEVRDGVDHIERVTDIWFLLSDAEAFAIRLKSHIDEHLGDL